MEGGTITAIHQDSKNKRRYHVYINDAFAFDIHEDVMVKYALWKGKEVDPELGKEILAVEEQNKAYQAALRYLGIRPRTARQLEKYLLDKEFAKDLVHAVRQLCEEQGYIDDRSFAKMWVKERLLTKAKSPFVLQMELRQKGVPQEYINEALEQIKSDEELAAARKLVAKKVRHADEPIDYETERKLLAMLMRKGFSSDVIGRIRRELRRFQE